MIATAQQKHFGHAAAACGITQFTLSVGLKQLEEELGVPLVRRGHRFFGFTTEGELVLECARRLVSGIRAMKDDVEALKQGLSGHLRVAAVPTALPMVVATGYRQHIGLIAGSREPRPAIVSAHDAGREALCEWP